MGRRAAKINPYGHGRILFMARFSTLQLSAYIHASTELYMKSIEKKRDEVEAFSNHVIFILNEIDWSDKSTSDQNNAKQKLSQMLSDAGFETCKRSRFSNTALRFALKALRQHSDNKFLLASRSTNDPEDAVKNMRAFLREMGCDMAFYKAKVWAETAAPGPLTKDAARIALGRPSMQQTKA
jgi:hypothetical protein